MSTDQWLLLGFVLGVLSGLAVGVFFWFRERLREGTITQDLKIKLAEVNKEREADAEKLQWVDRAQQEMRDAFEALASQSLHTNADAFMARAGEQLNGILGKMVEPLTSNLDKLDMEVRELEKTRTGAYSGLQEQLRQLLQTHLQLQNTTTTIAQALKSSTVRGRWGEMQLHRVVEMAGMKEHVDFEEQVVTEEGRPDMIIRLPNGGIVPVDSKTPMDAYLEAMETGDESKRRTKLLEHTKAMQNRVRDLARKAYWQQFDKSEAKSPEFVVMFIPNEACLCAAFDYEPGLFEFAIGLRVFITTPVTLLALLKGAAYGWQQYQVAQNIRGVAQQGKEIHDRLTLFVGHLNDTGKKLNQAVEAYNRAIASMESRVLPATRRFRDAGIVTDELPDVSPIEQQARLLQISELPQGANGQPEQLTEAVAIEQETTVDRELHQEEGLTQNTQIRFLD